MAERHHTLARWRERMTFDAYTTTGHHLILDASPPNGDDRGPRPMELLLTALSGCTGMDVLSILQKKREPVEAFEVYVEGVRAETHPKVFVEIDVLYRVTGNVKPESVERAIELSRDKYCGVSAMLHEIARINYRYEILAGKGEQSEPATNSAA